jgi:hypothetical protein
VVRSPARSFRQIVRAFVVLVVIAATPRAGSAQQADSVPLVLRSRTIFLSPQTTRAFWQALRTVSAPRLHGVIWLRRDPSPQERDSLRRTGIHILSPLPHGVFWAAVARDADTVRAPLRPRFFAKLAAGDRVAPDIWSGNVAGYSSQQGTRAAQNYVLNADGTLNVFVLFHQDTRISDAENILRAQVRKFTRLSDVGWKATGSLSAIRQLAERDEIRWIDAPPPPILPENNNTRQTINVDAVQNFNTATGQVQGLGGSGITVGVFDFGIDETHPDFGSRVLVSDIGKHPHATHVAGVIAGDGTLSTGSDSWGNPNNGTPYLWRGMAPQAQLIDADANMSFVAAKVREYISVRSMDISNHSYSYSADGEYNAAGDGFHDQLIRGDATSDGTPIPAREYIYSSGNSGDQPRPTGTTQKQIGYFSLTKQAKNGIMVGAFDPQIGQINPISSLGPAYDGRIKPDIVAPGTNVRSTGYCSLTLDDFLQCSGAPSGATSRSNFYHLAQGSSDAAAAVTGMLALALQQFEATFGATNPGWVPRPSTLRAITIQSADDIAGPLWYTNADGPVQAFPGPDFVTGYGMVNAKNAVDLITGSKFREDFITAVCDSRTWWVKANGASPLKVTLAWDDWPGGPETPYTLPRLVNDLDLELVAPSSSTVSYPWLLDQTVVNSAGVAIPDAQQTCDSDVTVQRKVLPTPTPKFYGVGDPRNVNDALSGGVLQAATTGKDHLNNAEQVVVSAPTNGWWKIHVTGFKVPHPSQTFSLAASEPLWLFVPTVLPSALCWSSPQCPKFFYNDWICERIPNICSPIEIKPGHLEISFSRPGQAVFIPVDRLCLFLVDCPPCIREGICNSLDISFANLSPGFTITLYDIAGRRVFVDKANKGRSRMRVKISPKNRYVVAIQPGLRVNPNKRYDLLVRANGL